MFWLGKYPNITSKISTNAAEKHPDLLLRKYFFVATNTAGTNPQFWSKTPSFIAANPAQIYLVVLPIIQQIFITNV